MLLLLRLMSSPLRLYANRLVSEKIATPFIEFPAEQEHTIRRELELDQPIQYPPIQNMPA